MGFFRCLACCASMAAAVSLSGCMLAPGQYVNPEGWFSSANDRDIEVIPITAKLLATTALQQSNALPAELLSYKPSTYTVGTGDILYITVWDHPELTAPAGGTTVNDMSGRQVGEDGSIFYPYIGKVQVTGKTVGAIREEISRRLLKFLEAPQVDVSVQRYASQKVFLAGAFQRAEPLAITTSALTLAEALGRAGVNPQEASLAGLDLIRDGVRYRLNLDGLAQQGVSLEGLYLKANDTLYLNYSERKKVYMMGEVTSQRALAFKTSGMSLTEALSSVGGLRQDSAKGKSVYVIRGVPVDPSIPGRAATTTVYQLNANSATSLMLASQFMLQPGDVVYTGPAQITRWNRFVSQLIPSSWLANTVDTISNRD